MDRRGRMLKLSLLLIVGSITQALNTPNCTDLPKQQKRFRSEAWLRLRQKQTFAESFNNGGTRLKGRI